MDTGNSRKKVIIPGFFPLGELKKTCTRWLSQLCITYCRFVSTRSRSSLNPIHGPLIYRPAMSPSTNLISNRLRLLSASSSIPCTAFCLSDECAFPLTKATIDPNIVVSTPSPYTPPVNALKIPKSTKESHVRHLHANKQTHTFLSITGGAYKRQPNPALTAIAALFFRHPSPTFSYSTRKHAYGQNNRN